MPVTHRSPRFFGAEPLPIVGHHELDLAAVGPANRELYPRRVGVGHDVSHRLLRHPEYQALSLLGEQGHLADLETSLQSPRRERRNEVLQGRTQPLLVQSWRRHGDDQGAQVAYGLAQLLGCAGDQSGLARVSRLCRPVRHPAQGEGGSGQALHHRVVEVCRDAAPLVLPGVQGALQEALALALALLDPLAHRPGQRGLNEEQEEQAADERRRDSREQPALILGYRVVPEVGLEQHRMPARGAQPHVHLEQLVVRALEEVLGRGEVRQASVSPPCVQRGAFVGPQHKRLADEAGFVGVHDPAPCIPHLHPYHAVVEDPGTHLAVQCGQGPGVLCEHPVDQEGDDRRPSGRDGDVAGVAHGLLPRVGAQDQDHGQGDHEHRGQATGQELGHGPPRRAGGPPGRLQPDVNTRGPRGRGVALVAAALHATDDAVPPG